MGWRVLTVDSIMIGPISCTTSFISPFESSDCIKFYRIHLDERPRLEVPSTQLARPDGNVSVSLLNPKP